MQSIQSLLRFIYSVICYSTGVASLIIFILFVSDWLLPKTVNTMSVNGSLLNAVLINLLALSLFGLQHSLMARRSFKLWLTRFIHPSMERSTYILSTAFVIVLMCYMWVPMGEVVWQVHSQTITLLIQSIAVFGWTLLLAATFMLNHFELFGLSQTFNPLVGKAPFETGFRTPGIYKFIRHPIQTGVLIGMWSVPLSTVSHIMFAGGMSIYIVVGLYFEERDLVRDFGDDYLNYMARVKRLIPFVH
ncbi:methyltransferase family protein [Aliikangiella sp. IMCC44653]